MKKLLGFLPLLFSLYFVFVHPAIIYYSGAGRSQNTYDLTFFYLSIGLWTLIFLISGYLIYRITFQMKSKLEYLLNSGQRIPAEIVRSKLLKSTKKEWEKRELLLTLKNLKGEDINHKLQILDSKPWQKRYEKGNRVYFRINPELKSSPALVLEGIQPKIQYIFFVVWFLFLLGVIGYYLYVYQWEGNHDNWNFMGPWHPILISAYCVLGFTLLFYLFFARFVLGIPNRKQIQLKFKGRKTLAQIVNIAETGTRINNQPLVKFELEFTDHLGRLRHAEIRKVVSVVNLAAANQSYKTLFYLEEDPTKIAFEEDLLETS